MILPTINFSHVEYARFRKMDFKYIPGKSQFSGYFESVGAEKEEYNPFDIVDLYERFAKLNESNPADILGFINKFGPIKLNQYDGRPVRYIEEYKDWFDEIRQMRKAVLMKDLYLSKNILFTAEVKRNELEEFKDSMIYRYLNESLIKADNKETREQNEYDLKIACLSELQWIFNDHNHYHLNGISFTPFVDVGADGNPRFISELNFKSLLSAMYWQLYLVFFESEPVFTCESCKRTDYWGKKSRSFLCDKCQKKKKYENRLNDPKLKAHDSFFRKISYHSSRKLSSLESELRKESLWRAKTKDISEEDYLNWLKEQEREFMTKVEEYKSKGRC